METTTWTRIKKYTELQGTSGQEHRVRQAFRADLTPLVDTVQQDGLGGVFGVKQHADHTAPRVMFAAHMDEVGFIVTAILPSGAFKVAAVGGWNPAVISSQRFSLFTKDHVYPVVSSSVSPHLLRGSGQAPQLPTVDDMLFDAGFVDDQEAMAYGVRPGDFYCARSDHRLDGQSATGDIKSLGQPFWVSHVIRGVRRPTRRHNAEHVDYGG